MTTYQREVAFHRTKESLPVLFGGNNGGLSLSTASKECGVLDPAFEFLIPSVRTDIIYPSREYAASPIKSKMLTDNTHNEFVINAVYSDDERIVHNVDVLKELAVIVQRPTKYALRVLAEIERGQMSG